MRVQSLCRPVKPKVLETHPARVIFNYTCILLLQKFLCKFKVICLAFSLK